MITYAISRPTPAQVAEDLEAERIEALHRLLDLAKSAGPLIYSMNFYQYVKQVQTPTMSEPISAAVLSIVKFDPTTKIGSRRRGKPPKAYRGNGEACLLTETGQLVIHSGRFHLKGYLPVMPTTSIHLGSMYQLVLGLFGRDTSKFENLLDRTGYDIKIYNQLHQELLQKLDNPASSSASIESMTSESMTSSSSRSLPDLPLEPFLVTSPN